MEQSTFIYFLVFIFIGGQCAQPYNPNLKYVNVNTVANETTDISQYAPWINFVVTKNVSDIIRFKRAGVGPGLLAVFTTLFTTEPNNYKLHPNYTQRWHDLYTSTVAPLLKNHTIFGVYLGDELLWNCLPFPDLTTAVNIVRMSVGPSPVLVYNEAYPPIVDVPPKCGSGKPIEFPYVPRGLSWMSVDYYPDEGTVQGAQKMYRELLYPKMTANQKALYVSPAYGAGSTKIANRLCCSNHTRDGPNPPCHGNCTLAMIRWALSMYDWFRTDNRIVGTAAFHWSGFPNGKNDGRFEPGLKGMPILRRFWERLGHEIVSGKQRNITVPGINDK